MRFSDLLASSLSSLRQRLFRTSLTVLGVVIGTIAVVVMLSLGIGMSQAMFSQYEALNLNHVTVYGMPTPRSPGEVQMKMDGAGLKELEQFPGVAEVHPVWTTWELMINVGRHELGVDIRGVTPEYLDTLNLTYASGGPPPPGSQLSFVYGARVTDMFWDEVTQSPLDIDWDSETIFLTYPQTQDPGSEDPEVPAPPTAPAKKIIVPTAGVLYEPEMSWSENSTSIFADLDTMVRTLKRSYPGTTLPGQPNAKVSPERGDFIYSQFLVIAQSAEEAEILNNQLREAGYESHAQVEYIRQMQQQALTIQAVLGGIGFVSLLVAAIGIANTMLMSVYERTKEIGVMKVLGASLGDIRRMFLIESASIGFFGGLVGVLLSYLLSAVLNNLLGQSMALGYNPDGTPMAISVIPIPLAIGALLGAMLIGMISGFVPAQRATRLSPLDAIRSQ